MSKKIIAIILILVIIITTLIQTTSIFSNEHSLYQTVQDKCSKCHGDVKSQLDISVKHSALNCTYCHTKSATNHTNIKPECSDCHTTRLNDTLEAHSEFVGLKSDGCTSCHTNYNVILNYSRPEYIDYDISNQNGDWIISNFTTIGNISLSYNALRKGGRHNINETVSCKDCHKDIYDAVAIGGHAVVIDKNGSQSVRHSTTNYPNLTAWCMNCHNNRDSLFTVQHAARKTTCDECHETYGVGHPGNLYTNVKTIPRLYRSLVCISCKSTGWNTGIITQNNGTLHFTVRQEPYYDVTVR